MTVSLKTDFLNNFDINTENLFSQKILHVKVFGRLSSDKGSIKCDLEQAFATCINIVPFIQQVVVMTSKNSERNNP